MTAEKYQREIEEDIFRDLLAIFVHVNLPPNVFAKKTNDGKTRTAIDFKYPRFARFMPVYFYAILTETFRNQIDFRRNRLYLPAKASTRQEQKR